MVLQVRRDVVLFAPGKPGDTLKSWRLSAEKPCRGRKVTTHDDRQSVIDKFTLLYIDDGNNSNDDDDGTQRLESETGTTFRCTRVIFK